MRPHTRAAIGAALSVATGGLGCLIAAAIIARKVPALRRYDEDDLRRALGCPSYGLEMGCYRRSI